MFKCSVGNQIPEVSHKRIESPSQSVYFNHIHNHCELLLFISGQADYNIDGKVFKPKPYDLLFIPAATYHYLIPTAPVPYENYVIGVNPALVGKHYPSLFAEPGLFSAGEDEELLGFFKRLDDYHARYSAEDFAGCAQALLRELFTYCAYHKHRLRERNTTESDRLEQMIKYIHKNIEKPITAEDLARQFMLSKSYVQNLFSQQMRIGLKKYIMQKKVYLAHGDLAAGMRPLTVCEKYGFENYSTFYRLYRSTFGYAPGGRKQEEIN